MNDVIEGETRVGLVRNSTTNQWYWDSDGTLLGKCVTKIETVQNKCALHLGQDLGSGFNCANINNTIYEGSNCIRKRFSCQVN